MNKAKQHEKTTTKIGKLMALVLRHRPDALGLEMDEHGWVRTDDLIEKINGTNQYVLDMDLLEEIVRTDSKQRYSFNDDKTLIRANQGHSIPVDVGLVQATPPDILYHGTATRFTESIDSQGLLPQSRLYVHLSQDADTATNVGRRHGTPVVYQVDCQAMLRDGYEFFKSENGVWLTKEVPARYLSR